MSFVDMENEWENFREYSVAYGASLPDAAVGYCPDVVIGRKVTGPL